LKTFLALPTHAMNILPSSIQIATISTEISYYAITENGWPDGRKDNPQT